jgi:hypothetical protein
MDYAIQDLRVVAYMVELKELRRSMIITAYRML